ncbi:MAG: hypothetical protein FAZ92_01840 [Accumulibacter sp.]|uniref:HNH endonuclease n=1 Tax=Accumulibacter sp. TaxID=2053492 RepID=UPI0011FE959C|nr:HNH endonuclease [Accumulibacter sp.]QKS28442.1 MAG: HNH endonuclease [Candidatus Accumulibacter similis]TLD45882.1 MAG: hypothetical protein FAZ92_01840 [Accumulibacter sp.]
MRPVDKGAAPAVYDKYQNALSDLRARLGDYCSYCERQIETNLAVEHIQPKSRAAALCTDWANFLLGCVNCNSSKGSTPINLVDYLWPDADNTLRAFEYVRGGMIQPDAALAPNLAAKAQATISLTGLDRYPGGPGQAPTTADQRWLRRQQAWEKAEWARDILAGQDTNEVRELIVSFATARGEFSIWWTVFAADIDMRRRLREAFIGTHAASFDVNENPIPRTGGQL